MSKQRQRVRDPIHGLIIFEKHNQIDQLAWSLIDTPEFQRLRRIRQLGMSEYVFPSATHTRFAHSIGVYHNARRLMEVVKQEEGKAYLPERAEEILIAALLHDVGHGPFSHTFEGSREALAERYKLGPIEKHEKFSANIIRSKEGKIREILEDFRENFAEKVAEILESDDLTDFYHAVVSSSFDADRMDFLVRDRYMTGTKTGAIDEEWLIDNLAKHDVLVTQDDDKPVSVPTFVFKAKGRQAAEDFLLARYRLYTQVYLHKTTRGFEKLLSALILIIGDKDIKPEEIGMSCDNPLIKFLRQDSNLENYSQLDDTVVWGAISEISRSQHKKAKNYALKLLNREHLHVLDISAQYSDEQSIANAIRRIDKHVGEQLGIDVFKDEPPYNLYSRSGGEAEKMHKTIMVQDGTGTPKEIVEFPDTIIRNSLIKKKRLVRYYFLTAEDRQEAEKAMNGR
ncbi:HD domain-containing protein [Agrobacterium rosae]|uniref:Putative dGTPase n=1 Tax=Agrobacterium rosae TaxID=1972867 RepID=A0A1R3U1K7_9HYPH|nr:HD domain-containing protein [Agrobacterium rosae]SCX35014.1 putative dGTPase [Agrobacterium rosae]